MNKKKLCYLLVFAIIIILCNSCRHQYNEKIVANYMKSEPLIDFKDSTSYKIIPLEKRDEVIYNPFAKIQMNDSIICLLDNGSASCVYVFGTDGRFINKIFRLGRAKYEYSSATDMYLTGDTIMIYDPGQRKIVKYLPDGTFVGLDQLCDYRGMTFTRVDDKYLFYLHCAGFTSDNEEVLFTDKGGTVISSYIKRKSSECEKYSIVYNYFGKIDHNVYFIPGFSDKIKAIDVRTSHMNDFYNLNLKMSDSNVPDATNNGYSSFYNFFITDNGTFTCSTSKEGKSIDVVGNIFDSKKLRTYSDVVEGVYKNYYLRSLPSAAFEVTPFLKDLPFESEIAIMLMDTEKIKYEKD